MDVEEYPAPRRGTGDQGYPVSPQKVGQLLHASGYSLQATQKMLEGTAHPDRNDQFEYLNDRVDAFQGGAPVISVDTKKKELVGDYGEQSGYQRICG